MKRSTLWLMVVGLAACGVETTAIPQPGEPETLSTLESGLNQVGTFGGLGMYLYVPKQVAASKVPVVVALHGCTQTAEAYQAAGWNQVAEQRGAIVIYPEKTTNNACFGWFEPANARRGQGEARAIVQMIDWVRARYDVGEVFVTGLSGGGAMTAVMAAAYPEVFSAAAVMAGVPYRCADGLTDAFSCMNGGRPWSAETWGDLVRDAAPAPLRYPRLAVFHGAKDFTVAAVNAEQLVTQWTNVHRFAGMPTREVTGNVTHTTYARADGTPVVESFLIAGMGHGTAVDPKNACGRAAPYMLDVGLCSTRESARFFGLLAGTTPPVKTDAGTQAVDAGTPAVDAGTVPPPVGRCTEVRASNYAHVMSGRASLCGAWYWYACAKGSGQNLGLYNVYTSSWLKSSTPGVYELGRCGG